MVSDDAAGIAALGRVFKALDRENSQALLLAIGQRPDTVEKVQRFQAVEILSLRMLGAAVEYDRPGAAEWAQLWATMAQAAAGATWQRLGRTASSLTTADQVGVEVLLRFMEDAELMG